MIIKPRRVGVHRWQNLAGDRTASTSAVLNVVGSVRSKAETATWGVITAAVRL